jgi:hypothetical protein
MASPSMVTGGTTTDLEPGSWWVGRQHPVLSGVVRFLPFAHSFPLSCLPECVVPWFVDNQSKCLIHRAFTSYLALRMRAQVGTAALASTLPPDESPRVRQCSVPETTVMLCCSFGQVKSIVRLFISGSVYNLASFSHSFNGHLLSTYCVPVTWLGIEHTAVNKICSCSWGVIVMFTKNYYY